MKDAYISIEHLSKTYDKEPVLKDVNAVLKKERYSDSWDQAVRARLRPLKS